MSMSMQKEYAKAKKVLHPNSRKSIAIAKRTKKISNREKAKFHGLMKQTLVADKMLWIREHMDPNVCPYTHELTAALLETYIARNDEELEQIGIKRSIGVHRKQQHASREDAIRMTKERELEEYNTCGIEIPDILNASQCKMLKEWNGELRFLQNFKFRRYSRRHLQEALQKSNKIRKEPLKRLENQVSDAIENIAENVSSDINDSSSDECNVSTKNSETNDHGMEIE